MNVRSRVVAQQYALLYNIAVLGLSMSSLLSESTRMQACAVLVPHSSDAAQ